MMLKNKCLSALRPKTTCPHKHRLSRANLTGHLRLRVRSLVATQKSSFADSPVTNKPPITKLINKEQYNWPTSQETPIQIVATPPEHVDLVVAGGGPSGIAVAARVAASGLKVVVLEQDPFAAWPNNYGVWVDEFQALDLEDCLHVVWPKAKVWLHNGPGGEKWVLVVGRFMLACVDRVNPSM